LTPTIGMVGLIEPNTPRVTMEFKTEGDVIVLLGETRNAIGGTEYLKTCHSLEVGLPPSIDLHVEKALHETLITAIEAGLVTAAHDLSEGGLAITLAEMANAGNKGMTVDVQRKGLRYDALLFAESQSRAIVTVTKANLAKLETFAAKNNTPYAVLGVVADKDFSLAVDGRIVLNLPVTSVAELYEQAIPKLLK
jgi:phosphoribosylformylglycinamidine (FGAM) synthase-like enzyme